MKKLILTTILILFTTNLVFAHIGLPGITGDKWEDYIGKNVVVAYLEDNIIKAAEGKFILYGNIKDDHTIDKIYSYIILRTQEGIKVILVRNIEKMEIE
jgi:hypothetical protein